MLFLDEPTTGLDPRSRNQIWDSIRDLVREGTTLLLTTQYLEEADQLTDRIAVIDHGGVIAEGTGDELKDSVGGQMIEARLANAADRPRAIEALTQLGCGTPEPSASDRELIAARAGGRDHDDRVRGSRPQGGQHRLSPISAFAGPPSTTSSSP